MEKVAILLAVHNGAKYLTQQLDSILAQTHKDYICYIFNDGSIDESAKLIEQYRKDNPDKIKIIKGNSYYSAKKSFIYLVKETKEEYVLFCDQDDIWYENKIERMLKIANKHDRYNKNAELLICSDMEVVDEHLKIISKSYYKYSKRSKEVNIRNLLFHNISNGCSMLLNRKLCNHAFENINVENIYMHDWWVALVACVATKGKIIVLNEQTGKYRQHRNNTLGAKKERTLIEYINFLLSVDFIDYINNWANKIGKQAKELSEINDIDKNDKEFLISISNNLLNGDFFSKMKEYLKQGLKRKLNAKRI